MERSKGLRAAGWGVARAARYLGRFGFNLDALVAQGRLKVERVHGRRVVAVDDVVNVMWGAAAPAGREEARG